MFLKKIKTFAHLLGSAALAILALYGVFGNAEQAFGAPNPVATLQANTLVVDADGDVGIGATSPSAKLDVNGGLNASENITNLAVEGPVAITSFNGNDTGQDLGSTSQRICFLTRAGFGDLAGGGDNNVCRIDETGDQWRLTADSEGSGNVFCSAMCLSWSQEPLMILNLEAGSISLSLDGSATITSSLLDGNLQPVTETTSIIFSSNLGAITPATVDTDSNGVATTTFTAGDTSGLAIITAQTGSTLGSIFITVGSGPIPSGNHRVHLPLIFGHDVRQHGR